MKPAHIQVIKAFIDRDELLDIHSYTGYKGGIILRFRSSSDRFTNHVLRYCEAHDIEASFKYNHNLGTNEIFIVAEDDVYTIKPKS